MIFEQGNQLYQGFKNEISAKIYLPEANEKTKHTRGDPISNQLKVKEVSVGNNSSTAFISVSHKIHSTIITHLLLPFPVLIAYFLNVRNSERGPVSSLASLVPHRVPLVAQIVRVLTSDNNPLFIAPNLSDFAPRLSVTVLEPIRDHKQRKYTAISKRTPRNTQTKSLTLIYRISRPESDSASQSLCPRRSCNSEELPGPRRR